MALERGEVLLVILGAGASFDALDPERARLTIRPPPDVDLPSDFQFEDVQAPLTDGLISPNAFSSFLLQRHQKARSVIANLLPTIVYDNPNRTALEHALAEYQERSAHDDEVHRHMMSFRLYLRDLLWGCSHYAHSQDLHGGVTAYTWLVTELVDRAKAAEAHICFITFNYDLLLDAACNDAFGFDPLDFRGSLTNRFASVLRPHGSVAWHWPVDVGLPPDYLSPRGRNPHLTSDPLLIARAPQIANALSAGIDPEAVSHSPHALIVGQPRVRAGVPAVAIPLENKTAFVWPRAQEDFLTSLRGRVKRMLIIGWRAAEPHFNKLLRETFDLGGLHIHLVTGGPSKEQARESAEMTFENLGVRENPIHYVSLDGFRGMVGSEPVPT